MPRDDRPCRIVDGLRTAISQRKTRPMTPHSARYCSVPIIAAPEGVSSAEQTRNTPREHLDL